MFPLHLIRGYDSLLWHVNASVFSTAATPTAGASAFIVTEATLELDALAVGAIVTSPFSLDALVGLILGLLMHSPIERHHGKVLSRGSSAVVYILFEVPIKGSIGVAIAITVYEDTVERVKHNGGGRPWKVSPLAATLAASLNNTSQIRLTGGRNHL